MSAYTTDPVPQHAAPRPVTRRRRVVVTAVVLTILAVEVVLGAPSLADALNQLRTPHWGWVVAAVVAEVVSMGGYARMQRRLLRAAGTRLSVRRHVALAYAAHSLSVTLPGGPLFSTRYNFQQMRRYGASAAVASWCIALSGILSSAALVLIGIVGGIVAGGGGSWARLVAYLAAAVAVAVGVRVVAQHPQWLIRPVERVLTRLNRVRGRRAAQLRERITALVDQISAVRIRPADFGVAAVLAVLNWLLDALCLWMCCRAVGAEGITLTELVIAYCAGMAAASIPIVPGGLGVVDGALILGLVTGGIATSDAIAGVVLYRLISFGFIITAGWIVWLLVRHLQRADTGATV
ncbi:lysylphosphatidylglycerol synthase transmembrane domain-containing protein [Micromonospora sp. NPDC049679]|uniref:lysylphosphatidylglycerol synthase transmembrane domain-containing protein n=1 Tax=Micromonospora sp. NPDC049679 TaxID=3155920 RepID=UPI0033CA5238